MSFPRIDEFLGNHPHWTDVLVGVTAAVAAAALIGLIVWLFRAFGQVTSLRVGANWTWEGTAPDPTYMTLHPNINVVSRTNAPRKIVHSIWVRESKSTRRPGTIYGKVDLINSVPVQNRTTGGDPLNLVGPTIKCKNLKVEVERVMNCPIWIQTSDGKWYRAQSMGNPPSFAERIKIKLLR